MSLEICEECGYDNRFEDKGSERITDDRTGDTATFDVKVCPDCGAEYQVNPS